MKSKKLTSVVVLMMSLIIMLGIFALPASAATSLSKATVTYEVYQTYSGKAIKPSATVKVGSKKLTKDKHYTVSYSNNKSVGKGYITIKGKGSYTGTIKKGFYIQPKATSSLKATAYSTKIKLSWSKVTGAKGYQVYQVIGKTSKKLPTVSGTSCTITGLDSVTEYTFKVRPYAKVGSKTIFGEFKTVKKSTTIGKPTTIEFSNITENSATLKWNKVQGATSYSINYVGGMSQTTTSTKETLTLTNLTKGTVYKVKIRAINSDKEVKGNYSDVFTFTTAPAAVKITSAKATSDAQVNLSWTSSAGATGYTVYYGKADAQGNVTSFSELGSITKTTATVGPFTPCNTYVFKVIAFTKTSSGIAYSSEAVTDKILIPLQSISGFSSTSVTKDSVSVKWDRTSDIEGYKLYKNNALVTTINDPKTTNYTFTGLSEGVSYNFAISAYSKSYESEKTTLTVTTGSGAVESVYFSSKPSVLKPGETFTLGVTVLPSDATDKSLIFESGNTSIATVSSTGVITAKADGTTTITVKSKASPDKKAYFTLTVRSADILATSISLKSEYTIYEGELISLNPTFTPADVTSKGYTVTGQNYNYTYKGGLLGTNTKSDTCEFDDYISISTTNLLKAKKATIEPKGDKKEFSFTVTVRTTDGSNKTATTKVKVIPRMLTVLYNGMEETPWYYGNSAKLSYLLDDSISSDYSDSDIRFKSSNTSVATVTNDGMVTCIGEGEVIITAYTSDGKYSATYEIYSRSIAKISKTYFESCKAGQTYQISAEVLPKSSSDTLMYYSLNTDVATVSNTGKVTFIKQGNAMITVSCSSDPYSYKEVWFTSGKFTAPSGSTAQLLSNMKTSANAVKSMSDLPTAMIKEKHVFENLKASTTTGATADISSLESTIESIFKPTTTFLSPGSSTKDDFIKHLPVRNQSYVIAPTLTDSDIQSIKVTDSGEYYYEISMTLKEETLSSLPTNPASTRHGKVFEIITQSLYDDLKAKTGLDPKFDSLVFRYHDSNLTLRINKVTGNVESATYNMTTDASVKSLKFTTLIPALNASATYTNIITVDLSGYKN